jgi:hypothetical protein
MVKKWLIWVTIDGTGKDRSDPRTSVANMLQFEHCPIYQN